MNWIKSLNWGFSAVRGIRTMFQSLAGLMVGMSSVESLFDIQVAVTSRIPVVLWGSFCAGFIAFAQNLAEETVAAKPTEVVVTNKVTDPVITEEAPK